MFYVQTYSGVAPDRLNGDDDRQPDRTSVADQLAVSTVHDSKKEAL